MRYVHFSIFSVVVVKSIFGIFIVFLMSLLFGVFSRLLLVERLPKVSSKDGRMILSIISKKDLSVVNPLVTAEREQVSFFCRDASFFFTYVAHFSVRDFCECLHFLMFVFNFILVSFFYPQQATEHFCLYRGIEW